MRADACEGVTRSSCVAPAKDVGRSLCVFFGSFALQAEQIGSKQVFANLQRRKMEDANVTVETWVLIGLAGLAGAGMMGVSVFVYALRVAKAQHAAKAATGAKVAEALTRGFQNAVEKSVGQSRKKTPTPINRNGGH